MSPITLPSGAVVPDTVPYTPLADAVTSVVTNGVVSGTRAPLTGEPAANINHLDNALQQAVAALNAILDGFASIGAARVLNTSTGQWEGWPIYVSATDPANSTSPPTGNYVWLNTTTA